MPIRKTGSPEAGNEVIELTCGSIKLVLDQKEIHPDDPGAGTPAMIYYETREDCYSSTYWCWEGTGTIDDYYPTPAQNNWLESKYDYVIEVTDKWYEMVTTKKEV